jgi:hypothetical protein
MGISPSTRGTSWDLMVDFTLNKRRFMGFNGNEWDAMGVFMEFHGGWIAKLNWFIIPFYGRYIISIRSYTSSTAQGGGGSFKNRKPIGEVGCCESGMAERSH